MEFLPLIVVVWVICGIIGALIAPRKGWDPSGGFVVGVIFGVFGIAYLSLQRDAAQGQLIKSYSTSGTSSPPGSRQVAPAPQTRADRLVDLEHQRERGVIDDSQYRVLRARLENEKPLPDREAPSRAPKWGD